MKRGLLVLVVVAAALIALPLVIRNEFYVNLASQIDARIEVEKDGNRVCGTSIMGLMMLGAAMGDTIVIHCDGLHAEEALEKLASLVEERFGEE